MAEKKTLYQIRYNPLLIQPSRGLPKEVAIIGAGTIGPDIGYYVKSALPNIRLYLVDVVEEALKAAEKRLTGYAQKAVDRRKMKEDKAKAVLENIVYTIDYDQIKNCDLVIEAATENIPLKQKIFETVEGLVKDDTIITSNTSSIPADRIFNKMKKPERATITHFFAPAWRSLPVEVILWDKVGQEVVDYLFWFFANTGKAPIITDNAICFMLDRIFDNWCNEAAYLLSQATASQIDKVAEEFVFAGPFYVLNMANGNPIIIETNTLQMEEGDHYKPASILASVDRWNTHRPGAKVEVPESLRNVIRDRLLGILFSQSFDIIDRGIGLKEDLNFGCQVALGFRKGPLDIMRDLGEDEVNRIMKNFAEARPGFPQPKESFSFYQAFSRFLLVDEIDGVKVITIRRPQAMNALNDEVMDEILSVFKQYEGDPEVKGFVITGYGTSAFSAGADIGKFPEMLGDFEASVEYSRDCAQVQLYMDKMNKPVVAAINGLALGGGLELAIRCHAIVAMKNARFQFPEITLGIAPGIGGCVVPYRRWPAGAELFHEMLCLARPIDAAKALELGIVEKVADSYGELISVAVERAKSLSENIPRIPDGKVEIPEIKLPDRPMAGNLALSKEAVEIISETIKEAAAANSLEEALEIGYKGFARTACTEAAKEGIGAFLQKRKPEFKK
ncbi:MAG: 3-hydroxyacyl-CoA dehydrogenase/enoyl-CoA hydratase family protein [Deltaproteobacteria bacterium]|nr:3-hydroxyacyl-CoA dehydrogenase/enoyl-CoA hydratase family protein [Deltaproteobacteria bacterium]MBW1928161.1 3-hydroxyacyl-CoA dehydrogenase/enoyl-CoA hydratase family protein [Deltaproteobacteria bacterium]MBW2025405.1 3-hydroxyacyl-CoA dehydrogenase/enoyl-CoA hydratase family protein [Deltaproteobacteria bacterium]MBW2125342.1 3-hydroxyacyl-CoA dehydrogenase/enoyl-CoA hydratase family protein [Deltaproteobacteria bacterium]RLB17226.1 MAG: 3-hydroxyacyl-CoA dehydrogenase/enoyl-CoA hydrata